MDGIAMTEMEKLKAGLAYRYDDAELVAMKDTASARCARLAAVDPLDTAERDAAAREILGEAGPELDIQPGFQCDNGKNIRVGRRFTANFNVTVLDGAPVTFGDYCMVGPGTLIATTGHPPGSAGPPRPPGGFEADSRRRRRLDWRQLHHLGRCDHRLQRRRRGRGRRDQGCA